MAADWLRCRDPGARLASFLEGVEAAPTGIQPQRGIISFSHFTGEEMEVPRGKQIKEVRGGQDSLPITASELLPTKLLGERLQPGQSEEVGVTCFLDMKCVLEPTLGSTVPTGEGS